MNAHFSASSDGGATKVIEDRSGSFHRILVADDDDEALRDQAAQLTKQLDGVKDASESTWDSVQATSQQDFDSLQEGFQKSRQWLSDKIAPEGKGSSLNQYEQPPMVKQTSKTKGKQT